jgi:hypothetical protein
VVSKIWEYIRSHNLQNRAGETSGGYQPALSILASTNIRDLVGPVTATLDKPAPADAALWLRPRILHRSGLSDTGTAG